MFVKWQYNVVHNILNEEASCYYVSDVESISSGFRIDLVLMFSALLKTSVFATNHFPQVSYCYILRNKRDNARGGGHKAGIYPHETSTAAHRKQVL